MSPGDPETAVSNSRAEDSIFAEATELPAAERESFVRARCAGDERLVESVLALLGRFDGLGSFLDAPAIGAPRGESPVPEGMVLAGRFRIVGRLGLGGMGVVYRAEDQELGETVALKMVRGIWLDDPDILTRFREEIRLARKVAHPNVCRIHDLFTDGTGATHRAFFTMEYLEGRSLAEWMKAAWRPDAGVIRSIVGGIAAGLDAAHAAGIVHRDLKPGNIMLPELPGGGFRPVIMDFGLAQALACEGGGMTRTGQIVGSPDYMAPEQFLGEPATAATDVFSLAAITYELATGARPWPVETLMKAASRRVSGEAPALHCGPGVPDHWDAVLGSALRRDPALRPKSAGEFVALLEKDSVLTSRLRRLSTARLSRRTVLRGAAVGSAAAAVSLIFGVYRYSKQNRPLRGDPAMVLTPAEAYAGYGNARALDFLMETQLRQSAHVRIPDDGTVRAAWRGMHAGKAVPLPPRFRPREARELALRSGARFVLFSSISRTGDDYKLELRLEGRGRNPDYADGVREHEFRAGDESALLRATRDAANWLRRELGEMPGDVAARAYAPEELATGNWRALQEFTLAEEAWDEEIGGRRADESVRRFRTALELDPGFALAAGELGDKLVATGKEDEGLRYQKMAIDLMDSRDLTDRDSLRIRGMYYQDTTQDEKAENLFSLWAEGYPKDSLPLFYKSKSLMRMGREEESFALRHRAAALAPDSFALGLGAAQAFLEAGDLDGAERAGKRLAQGGLTDKLQSSVEFGRFNPGGAREAIERMRGRDSGPLQCSAFAFSACLFAETGEMDKAEAEIRAGVRVALERGLPTSVFANKLILAKLPAIQGRTADARRECAEILQLKPGIRRTMSVGCVLARAGAVDEAKRCYSAAPAADDKANAYLATPVYEHWRKRLKAEIALAEGRAEEAAALLEDVPPPDLLDDWPEYIVRAFLAAKRYDRARDLIADLFQNPGRYWRVAETTGPGYFRWAAQQAMEHRLAEPGSPGLAGVRRALEL